MKMATKIVFLVAIAAFASAINGRSMPPADMEAAFFRPHFRPYPRIFGGYKGGYGGFGGFGSGGAGTGGDSSNGGSEVGTGGIGNRKTGGGKRHGGGRRGDDDGAPGHVALP